jgi:protein tyrosine phosphatase (PTP) superfamily phosphohydrolase (DUF442 family)
MKLISIVLLTLFLSACGTGATNVVGACPTDSGSGIANFCVVTKDVLWRGSKPDEIGSAWLINNGVKTVVNLELINDDVASLASAKVSATGSYDINYFRIRNWEPIAALSTSLQDEQVARFLAVMATSPKPVYVHCRSGQNRTGVNVAAYRILIEGASVDTAVAEMKLYEGIWSSIDAAYLQGIDGARKVAILALVQTLKASTTPLTIIRCRNGVCTSS